MAPVLAITLGVLTLGLDLAAVPLDSLTHAAGTGGPVADTFTVLASVVPTAAVGTLLAVRRPRNPIGWLMLAILIVGFSPSSEYAVLDYRMHHRTLPLGWAAVIVTESWPLFLFSIACLLWVFPDGKLPTGRWRRPSVVLVAAGVVICLAASSRGMLVVAAHDVRISPDGDLANPLSGMQTVLGAAVIAGAVASWVGWLASQVPAYRHASGERRQQLKWLYSGAAIALVSVLIGVFIVPVTMGETPGWGTQPVVNDLTTAAVSALPVCLGVAVLKYRLYELDRIISRVVSYTVITALLVGVYAGLVLLATRVLPFRTPVGVAAATLITAALFNPLRRRVQQLVDRRFNRSRYNAEAIVATFTGQLRHTVDLDAVRGDLADVVRQAFEPTHVSVWLPRNGQQTSIPAAALPGQQRPT